MAKQTGLYHIRGKVGDYKYYGMKGVDGTIMAKQNEGMSERVKTDAAYDNTRRNNYEFGMATSTAGAITKAFSQKWRYLLVPFATAKIAKEIFAVSRATSGNDWGDRTMLAPSIREHVPAIMQKFVKNDVSDFSPIAVAGSIEEGVTTLTASCSNMNNEKAASAGCDGVRALLVVSDLTGAEGGYSDKGIIPASCASTVIGSADVDFGESLSVSGTFGELAGNAIVSVVLLPYRTIEDKKYIMQEFCSAFFPAQQ